MLENWDHVTQLTPNDKFTMPFSWQGPHSRMLEERAESELPDTGLSRSCACQLRASLRHQGVRYVTLQLGGCRFRPFSGNRDHLGMNSVNGKAKLEKILCKLSHREFQATDLP